MISSNTSTGSSDPNTAAIPKRAGPGRPPINIHFDEFGNRITPKAPYKKRNPGGGQNFKSKMKPKSEAQLKTTKSQVIELKEEWEASLNDQLTALRPSRMQSAETSRAFLLGDSERLRNVRTKYEEGRRVFVRRIEGLCRSVGSVDVENPTKEKKGKKEEEVKERKLVDMESKEEDVQLEADKDRSNEFDTRKQLEVVEETRANEDTEMNVSDEDEYEPDYVSKSQKKKKRKADNDKAEFVSEEEVVVQSVEQSLRKRKYGLRARIMTKEETSRIPKIQLRETPPIFRNKGGDHKKYWHLASERDRLWFCQRKGLDPATGDPRRSLCSPDPEPNRGDESDFCPPPVEPMGPYGPFLEADYESEDCVEEWPPKFSQCGLGVNRTGFNSRGDPLPIRRHVEPRPLFHGNFANSLAANRLEDLSKKEKEISEERKTVRGANEGESVGPIARLTWEYLDARLQEIESKLENEQDGSNTSDSTDIEEFKDSTPPRPFQDAISAPPRGPILLRDRPWPHPAELTEWSMAVRHCKLTGEPWPVCRKGMALAAETALKRCTIPLEMLHDRAFEPGTDRFWALMYSKLGGGKTPSEGGKWSTRPDHVKEAAKLMREERPEFCEWIEKEWLVSDIIRRAVANVDRMQEEAWGNRRPDYTREEIRWNPVGMHGDLDRFLYIDNLETGPQRDMPNWEIMSEV